MSIWRWKKFADTNYSIRFLTEFTNVTDRQTVRRTDTAWRHRPCLHSIAWQEAEINKTKLKHLSRKLLQNKIIRKSDSSFLNSVDSITQSKAISNMRSVSEADTRKILTKWSQWGIRLSNFKTLMQMSSMFSSVLLRRMFSSFKSRWTLPATKHNIGLHNCRDADLYFGTRFDRIHGRDRQTDGRTATARPHRSCLYIHRAAKTLRRTGDT